MKYLILTSLFSSLLLFCNAQSSYTISSPDKNITVNCNPQQATYNISYKAAPVLKDSKLGIIRDDEDFSKDLKVIKASAPVIVKDSYSMLHC